jgi:hypothetical protein
MHRDPTGTIALDEGETYQAHEHVYILEASIQPPETCHRVDSYVCSVAGCGSARNEWPDTGEYIRSERDASGRYTVATSLWRHFVHGVDAMNYHAQQDGVRSSIGVPENVRSDMVVTVQEDGNVSAQFEPARPFPVIVPGARLN